MSYESVHTSNGVVAHLEEEAEKAASSKATSEERQDAEEEDEGFEDDDSEDDDVRVLCNEILRLFIDMPLATRISKSSWSQSLAR